MRHRNNGKILDRKKAPREMMARNLASSLFIYEKIKTTEAKAKFIRPMVENIVTMAKKNDLSSKKRIISILPQEKAVKKVVEIIGEKYKDRKGGYTRLVKVGNREGDGAKMVQIELV